MQVILSEEEYSNLKAIGSMMKEKYGRDVSDTCAYSLPYMGLKCIRVDAPKPLDLVTPLRKGGVTDDLRQLRYCLDCPMNEKCTYEHKELPK